NTNSRNLADGIFASVFIALNEAGVPFLVIGGHAVVLHGHLRNTLDLDLLIADSKLAMARAALIKLGYRTYFETDAFLQLQAPEHLPPLDLMIVDDQTFGRIEVTANQKVLDGRQIRIPDPWPHRSQTPRDARPGSANYRDRLAGHSRSSSRFEPK